MTSNADDTKLRLPHGHAITPCVDTSVDPHFDPNVKRVADPNDPYLNSVSPYVDIWLHSGKAPLTIVDLAQTGGTIRITTVMMRIREVIIYNSTAYDMRIVRVEKFSGDWAIWDEAAGKMVKIGPPSGTVGPGQARSYVLWNSVNVGNSGHVSGVLHFEVFDPKTNTFICNLKLSCKKRMWETAYYAIETNNGHRDFDVTALDTWGNEWFIPGWPVGGEDNAYMDSGGGFGQNNHAIIAFCVGDDVLKIGQIPGSGKCDLYEKGFYASLGKKPPTSAINRPDYVWGPASDRWKSGVAGEALDNLIGGLAYGCDWLFGGKDTPNRPQPDPWRFSTETPEEGKTYIISECKNSGDALGYVDTPSHGIIFGTLLGLKPNFIRDRSQQWRIKKVKGGEFDGLYVLHNMKKDKVGGDCILAWGYYNSTVSVRSLNVTDPVDRFRYWRLVLSQDKRSYILVAGGTLHGHPFGILTGFSGTEEGYRIRVRDNSSSQSFVFTEFVPLVTGAKYVITSRLSGKVMDVLGGEKGPGTPVVQYPYTGGNNQHWVLGFKTAFTRVYFLTVDYAPHCMLHADDRAGDSIPVTIDVVAASSWHNFKWNIDPSFHGSYRLSGNYGKQLDVTDGRLDNYRKLQLFKANNTLAQLWQFSRVGSNRRDHEKSDLDRRIEKAEHDIAEVVEQIRQGGDPTGDLAKWVENNLQELERMKAERDGQEALHLPEPDDI
ncbi:RICIN domain-containing protein [Glaciimonas sp. Gout2]|uniref:RICIN domain-containing protein n=1 Tax=unclassified Glaciimonas TaxID=2644401 RepID=UPI002B23B6A9|nr:MULTISPECIES: RICIN domain-containing protein [unclassified Glaciimonas]MEB0013863.1 RICIN domain-containing protein [Glaciimonas sp. Cout2]MEB0083798.1 RICIN domain-containing protein [Glaciimonas sp. Gout2]